MMKKILFLSILAIFPLVFLPKISSAAEIQVEMNSEGFSPQKIQITQGDTVVFTNKDTEERWPASNLHPTHEIYPEFDPKTTIEIGKEWSFTFTKSGTWKYHDHILPQHSGTVEVKADPNFADKTAEISTQDQGFWAKLWNWIKSLWPWGEKKIDTETTATEKSKEINLSDYDKEVVMGEEKIFQDDTFLGSHLKKYGVKDTITQLRLLEAKFGSCHQPAHRAGHIGYKMFGDKAFVEYSAECQSGYYHGVMEAYFQEHGAEDIQTTLTTLCKGGINSFFEHQCVHGIGHGLQAWANYELPEALAACDQLPKRQDSCYTGVFMENLAAKLAQPSNAPKPQDVGNTDTHLTKYLKNDDALYPCNWVEEKYKGSCFFLQTSRMLQMFGVDFQKISEACSKAPAMYQNSCFGSMGRDVGGSFPNDAAREIKECGYVKDSQMRIECLNGAVQNGFWDPTGQDFAIGFCKLLTDQNEKSACYSTIISRAPEIMFDIPSKQAFCTKVESDYLDRCKTWTKITE